MDLKINNKWALVTGGANGIGRQISIDLASEGVNLLITSRTEDSINKLKEVISEEKVEIHGLVVDFLENNWQADFFNQISDRSIDILVNNAGHNLEITDPYCSIENWKKILDLNFFTAVEISNFVIPKMRNNKWGRIVNITSVAGVENMGPVTYGVSKAALTTYTRTMGRILATEGGEVVMSAVFPGVIRTEGGHWDKIMKVNPDRASQYLNERCPLGRFGTTKEISSVVLFYCSDLASFSHGAIIPADGGQARSYHFSDVL